MLKTRVRLDSLRIQLSRTQELLHRNANQSFASHDPPELSSEAGFCVASRSEAELEDEGDRTTPTGLFHYAHSYWLSALALQSVKVNATHPEVPIWFLYIHAVELYLKSFLRAHRISEKELRTKYGHRVCCLADEARKRGLHFDDEDIEVLSLIICMDVIALRYIKTGAFTRPTHEALNRTSKSLHNSVGQTLREKGFSVRLPSQYAQEVGK